jgi:hypothetical protein
VTAGSNPTRRGEPVHVVLDSQGLTELAADTPSRRLLVALEAAVTTAGTTVLPTSVMLEQRFDPAAPRAANANRRLRAAVRDTLDPGRAVEAGRLLAAAADGPSVVDAHVAGAAVAALRGRVGACVVVTSDPGDINALLVANPDQDTRSRTSVEPL